MNAAAMIETCLRRQQGEAPYVPTAQANETARETPYVLHPSDTGVQGHAGHRAAHEDRRDDGTPLVSECYG